MVAPDSFQDIKLLYKRLMPEIKSRLNEFRKIWDNGDNYDIFREFAFCLLTPQSKARICWNAIENLGETLFYGDQYEISKILYGVRFKNNKSKYIVEAREKFSNNGKIILKDIIQDRLIDVFSLREWLVENVKGMGYKEASHFLRNIGFGKNFAILDRHILKNLNILNVINDVPKSLSRKQYLVFERNMFLFSEFSGIPMEHLDLVFWYKETGEIFK